MSRLWQTEGVSSTSRPARRALHIPALGLALGVGLSASFVFAQANPSPAATPWGSPSAGGPSVGVSVDTAGVGPDGPSTARASGTQRAALRTLAGSPVVPPAELGFLSDALEVRAAGHRHRADALDALAVRSARRIQALVPRASEPEACAAAGAARRAMDLSLSVGLQRAATARALELEAGYPAEVSGAGERLRHLRAHAGDSLLPALAAAGCTVDSASAPRVHLGLEERRTVASRVVFFVQVSPRTPVIWVNGHPEGLAESDGWGVLTGEGSLITLCASSVEADRCAPTHRAVPAMGDAYVMVPRLAEDPPSPPPASPTP